MRGIFLPKGKRCLVKDRRISHKRPSIALKFTQQVDSLCFEKSAALLQPWILIDTESQLH